MFGCGFHGEYSTTQKRGLAEEVDNARRPGRAVFLGLVGFTWMAALFGSGRGPARSALLTRPRAAF